MQLLEPLYRKTVFHVGDVVQAGGAYVLFLSRTYPQEYNDLNLALVASGLMAHDIARPAQLLLTKGFSDNNSHQFRHGPEGAKMIRKRYASFPNECARWPFTIEQLAEIIHWHSELGFDPTNNNLAVVIVSDRVGILRRTDTLYKEAVITHSYLTSNPEVSPLVWNEFQFKPLVTSTNRKTRADYLISMLAWVNSMPDSGKHYLACNPTSIRLLFDLLKQALPSQKDINAIKECFISRNPVFKRAL